MGAFDFTGELEKLDDWEMPETKGGAHCGNGCAPPFVSINRGGVLNVAYGRLHGADATGGDDGRLGSSYARGRGDRAL